MTSGLVDNLIDLPTAARLAGVSLSSVRRWMVHGSNGNKLRVVKVGAQVRTSRDWLADFVDRCTEAAGFAVEEQPAPRSPSRRQREHAKADAACEKAGW